MGVEPPALKASFYSLPSGFKESEIDAKYALFDSSGRVSNSTQQNYQTLDSSQFEQSKGKVLKANGNIQVKNGMLDTTKIVGIQKLWVKPGIIVCYNLFNRS